MMIVRKCSVALLLSLVMCVAICTGVFAQSASQSTADQATAATHAAQLAQVDGLIFGHVGWYANYGPLSNWYGWYGHDCGCGYGFAYGYGYNYGYTCGY